MKRIKVEVEVGSRGGCDGSVNSRIEEETLLSQSIIDVAKQK